MMPEFSHVSWLGVARAALSAFLLGGLWYSPLMFLSVWNRESGRATPPDPEEAKHGASVFLVAFVMAFVAAAVFAAFLPPDAGVGLSVARGVQWGIGFVAMSFGINYAFSGKSPVLFLVDGGYHVVQFVLYGLVLGLL